MTIWASLTDVKRYLPIAEKNGLKRKFEAHGIACKGRLSFLLLFYKKLLHFIICYDIMTMRAVCAY